MNDVVNSVVFDAYPKVSLQEFIPELAFEFTEMPEEAFPHYLLKAIDRFARNSNALRRTVHICTQNCVNRYLIDPPDCMQIVALLDICGDTCGAHPVRLTSAVPCLRGCASSVWFERPNIIGFSQPGGSYQITLSVTPTRQSCEVDEILLTDFAETILDGTRHYLYGMTGKPWSSVQRSQESEMRFIQGIRQAAVETLTGGQRGTFRLNTVRKF